MAKDTSGLCIKLKIPNSLKPPENLRGEEDLSRKLQAFSRVSHFCNKGFSSGKALGGHIKMHVQAQKKIADDQETCRELYNNGGRSGKRVCFSCRKVFPSRKSLFGHMRSHPERTWRGIQPPEVANRHSSSSTLSDVDSPEFKFDDRIDTAGTTRAPAMDLSRSLLGWSVTAKRGRRSISSAASSHSSSSLEDQMYDAVNDLMLFAANRETSPNNDQDSGDPDCFPRKKMRKAPPADHTGNSELFKPEKSAETRWVYGDGEDDSDRRKNISAKQISEKIQDEKPELNMDRRKLMKKKGKKMRLVDLDLQEAVAREAKKKTLKQPQNNNTYRCSTCSKIFSNHQALGGHRSSHNKGKNVSDIEAQAEAQVREEENQRGRKMLDFDLNKLPSLNEEDDEEEGIKNGDFYGSLYDHS